MKGHLYLGFEKPTEGEPIVAMCQVLIPNPILFEVQNRLDLRSTVLFCPICVKQSFEWLAANGMAKHYECGVIEGQAAVDARRA